MRYRSGRFDLRFDRFVCRRKNDSDGFPRPGFFWDPFYLRPGRYWRFYRHGSPIQTAWKLNFNRDHSRNLPIVTHFLENSSPPGEEKEGVSKMGAIKGSFFFFSWQPAISKTILLRLKARIRDLLSISSFPLCLRMIILRGCWSTYFREFSFERLGLGSNGIDYLS